MGNSSLNCIVKSTNLYPHHSQLYTGLVMLHNFKLINLTQSIVKDNVVQPEHILFVTINNVKICYDVSDGDGIDNKSIEEVDFYFKRSFNPQMRDLISTKIFPLGLNYELKHNGFDFFELNRVLAFNNNYPSKLKNIFKIVLRPFISPLKLGLTVDNLYSKPRKDSPKVLFMVRAWDPTTGKTAEFAEQSHYVNYMRAKCIEGLKKEFKSSFIGGFNSSEYTKKNYSKLIIDNNDQSSKSNYIKLLRQSSICVATTGLFGSIGWKFGEYMAFSKAIVSEKLEYSVPGSMSKENNYLEFDSPEKCVEQVSRLYNDDNLRYKLMANNNRYYHEFLRPDKLILNSLNMAMNNN